MDALRKRIGLGVDPVVGHLIDAQGVGRYTQTAESGTTEEGRYPGGAGLESLGGWGALKHTLCSGGFPWMRASRAA